MAMQDIDVKCLKCGNLNQVDSSSSGRRKRCSECSEYLLNPKKELERKAYNQVKRGIVLLMVFCLILILPYVIEFMSLTLLDDSHRDEELVASENQQFIIDYPHESCEPGMNYNKSECEFQMQLDSIISAGLQILLLGIPLYGLGEIYGGLNKLSKRELTKF